MKLTTFIRQANIELEYKHTEIGKTNATEMYDHLCESGFKPKLHPGTDYITIIVPVISNNEEKIVRTAFSSQQENIKNGVRPTLPLKPTKKEVEISQDSLITYLIRYATSKSCPNKITYNDGFSDGKRELARQVLEDFEIDF